DLGAGNFREEIGGHEFAVFVVIVRVAGKDDPKPVTDSDARRANEESARKGFARGPTDGVEGLPSNEHGDDGCLAGASGEFQGNAEQLRVGLFVGRLEVVEELPPALALMRGDFSEPNGGFDGFDFAEEGSDGLEGIASPVL